VANGKVLREGLPSQIAAIQYATDQMKAA